MARKSPAAHPVAAPSDHVRNRVCQLSTAGQLTVAALVLAADAPAGLLDLLECEERRRGGYLHPVLAALRLACFRVRTGQERPSLDRFADTTDGRPMPLLVSTEEAARLLGVSSSTLKRLVR